MIIKFKIFNITITKSLLIWFLFLLNVTAYSQTLTKKALFLGNSYTYVNDLPQMVADMASSTGDMLVFDSNTPGGYTLQQHSTNTISISKINSNTWNYVVLQEQSQLPSLDISIVQTDVYPYAKKLDSIINSLNPCTETVFYMTWGRKNGDSFYCPTWPLVCTYYGMDSLLQKRYKTMADTNSAFISPVGAVWRYIRDHYPTIDLYVSDDSHPSVAGTYAAACAFYTTFYRKDPSLISFNSSLSASDAANIRIATKNVVYDNFTQWNIGKYDPVASFSATVLGLNQLSFINTSLYASSSFWNFGDGNTSSVLNPTHTYSASGTYSVSLKVNKCNVIDSILIQINTDGTFINPINLEQIAFSVFPNPSSNILFLKGNFPSDLKYSITALDGKLISDIKPANDKKTISIQSLSDGLYFLNLYSGDLLIGLKKFEKTRN